MSPLELAGPVGAVAGQIHVARLIAAASFLCPLLALGFGLLRAKKQALHDDVEAALEADFLRLERDVAAAPARQAQPGRAPE